jgi:hypothetical protein
MNALIRIGLWAVAVWLGYIVPTIHATRVNFDRHPAFQHNATLHRRNNINKYGGCNKVYDEGKGRDIVYQAYQDMLRLTQAINPFLVELIGDQLVELDPGVLEDRFLQISETKVTERL